MVVECLQKGSQGKQRVTSRVCDATNQNKPHPQEHATTGQGQIALL